MYQNDEFIFTLCLGKFLDYKAYLELERRSELPSPYRNPGWTLHQYDRVYSRGRRA